jgi:hypothetical protein
MANQLIDVLKRGRLPMYKSRELRDAAAKTVVHESSRGFRLAKAKGGDRVDPIIALAMGVLLAGRKETSGSHFEVRDFWSGELMFDSRNPPPDSRGYRQVGDGRITARGAVRPFSSLPTPPDKG